MELLPGILTPQGHESLVQLASWMPFRRAAELLDDLLGIRVSGMSSRRYTEAAGAAYEQLQDEEVDWLEKARPPAEPGAEKLQISADGAMVPLVHGVWAEVKTVVIGEIQPAVEKQGERVVHARNLSYFSRKANAEIFQRLALVEFHRRGVEHAQAVAAIMDGAEWEQGFTDYHCPRAIRILDFPHAAEHVNKIGECFYGEHTPESQIWLKERLQQLKQEGPDGLLRELHTLQSQYPQEHAISSHLAYLEKRKEYLRYPLFQAQGWPIGSGIVESGNKLVVEARLKGSGMHWADRHVNPMLALRNILCSHRWKEEWPKIESRLRHQTRLRRTNLHHARHTPQPLPAAPLTVIDPRLLQLLSPRHHPIKPHPKPNPWRNFKFGRALYQPSIPPKK